ncbi:hypothetical protein [Haloprofundus salilacus]|uniref:hypothetical protein n=1 Tax=Haloprofundus salilacus TaxID=2876190 RepID=UPI001CCC8C48|nr:hypothetical protein [Haloprofundus salilacus]
MSTDRVLRLISRTIDGVEALVNIESGEIFIDVPATTPQYIRVEEGDMIQEGDIRSRTEKELEAPTLRKWTVEQIGRNTVVGTDLETGEQHEWERESLEKQLAIGALSTNLTNFDRINVTGEAKGSNHEGQTGEESIVVILYGNDGRKFTQTYRVIDDESDGDERHVELMESDERVEMFEPDLRKRFDQVVEHTLETEGYAV